jgi:quinoprotein glucose dehydrogenase
MKKPYYEVFTSKRLRWGVPEMKTRRAYVAIACLLALSGIMLLPDGRDSSVFAASKSALLQKDWSTYDGQPSGDHYSDLRQINRKNVHTLKRAWIFDTGEKGGLQTNPLVVGHRLFAYTPTQKVIALDAASGNKLWVFDVGTPGLQPTRGLTYWTDGPHAILFAGILSYLYALDPATGKPISSFGDRGRIDLRKNIAEGDVSQAFAALTSPGVIYKDTIILGFRTPETKPALRGDIRAYDVHSGRLRWTFHTIPRPGEAGYETWPRDAWKTAGAANNWAGMAVDDKLGIVYVPTGSAVSDFYGYDRVGDDLYANCLLALDANTGRLIWHFQGVHHDIWDRDFPAPPALVTVRHNGKLVDAVAQTSKQGFVFLFDRRTGKPLFPIAERPFPASKVPGEQASRTQPIPLAPAPFGRQRLTSGMLTTRTPAAHAAALKAFAAMRSKGLFVPFSVDKQTVIFPGFDGGAEWGGPAVDVNTGVLYVNANDIAWTGGLTKNKRGGGLGYTTYQSQCSMCHGGDRRGVPPAFPSLIDIQNRLSDTQITEVVRNGKGRMPASTNVEAAHMATLLDYLKTGRGEDASSTVTSVKYGDRNDIAGALIPPAGEPEYRFTGYRKFLDPDGYPAVAPPWGTLSAIDLNNGKYLWKIPLGEYPELAAKGTTHTGTENYGGPVVTAGGLVIISATNYDHKIRAFDSRNGTLLWSSDLPYSGNATPAIYMVNGRQYIVIAASGARDPKGAQGAAYVAFALP